MGPGCSVSGNKYFTAGNANKHRAATVLYLVVIFQFTKKTYSSSQIPWYFNRHNISPTCINGKNVFLKNQSGKFMLCGRIFENVGKFLLFRERTQRGCVSSTLIALIAIKILRRRMKCFREGPFWRLASSWGRLSRVSSVVCSGHWPATYSDHSGHIVEELQIVKGHLRYHYLSISSNNKG